MLISYIDPQYPVKRSGEQKISSRDAVERWNV